MQTDQFHIREILNDYDPSQTGVDYSPFDASAKCPRCGYASKPSHTRMPVGAYRIRYHRCERCELRFKSVEHDPTRSVSS